MSQVSDHLSCFDSIESELGQVHRRIKQLPYAPDEQIQQCMAHLNQSSGKMIRPALVLLSGACFGPVCSEHIDLAAMVELIHRASLLHDDVIDSAHMRRGHQTANALWGNTAAVLLGDVLLSQAFSLGVSVKMSEASEILSHTALQICCGELQQNFWKGCWDITFQQYYQLIEAKTAALFKSSCCLGAMASKAASEQVEKLSQFGHHLGIAFQITDDLMDIVGTSKQAGKTLGTDLVQGKLTLPVIHWIQQDQEKKEIRKAQLDQGVDPTVLIQEMTNSGSISYAVDRIHEQILQAEQQLDEIQQSPAKQSLCVLADFVSDRVN